MHESAVKAMMIMTMGMLGLWAVGTAAPIKAATDMHRAVILPERPDNLARDQKRKVSRRR